MHASLFRSYGKLLAMMLSPILVVVLLNHACLPLPILWEAPLFHLMRILNIIPFLVLPPLLVFQFKKPHRFLFSWVRKLKMRTIVFDKMIKFFNSIVFGCGWWISMVVSHPYRNL
jgi:hypothetical protein